MKKNLICVISVTVLVCFIGCKKNIPVTGISIATSDTTIMVEDAVQLTATVEPADASNKTVIWSASDVSVADVSSSGLITGLSVGEAVVTATTEDGAFKDSCEVTVLPTPITGDISGHELLEDEVWEGNITLHGDIEISNGITLTILPGTVIKVVTDNLDWDEAFTSGMVDFYSHGNMVANGTEDNPIIFTVDSDSPDIGDWWGIGLSSGSTIDLKYCCIAYAQYGLFVFSTCTSTIVVENSMFAYSGGIVDFGNNSNISYNTFINGDYGYKRWEVNRTTNVSYCVFWNNSMIDIEALDSYCSVIIDHSNFTDNEWYNLYIGNTFNPDNVEITASNCYGITTTNDNGCGIITINSPSVTPISDAGCGFELSDLPVKKAYTAKTKTTLTDIINDEALMKEYNEKDKYRNR